MFALGSNKIAKTYAKYRQFLVQLHYDIQAYHFFHYVFRRNVKNAKRVRNTSVKCSEIISSMLSPPVLKHHEIIQILKRITGAWFLIQFNAKNSSIYSNWVKEKCNILPKVQLFPLVGSTATGHWNDLGEGRSVQRINDSNIHWRMIWYWIDWGHVRHVIQYVGPDKHCTVFVIVFW